MAYPKTVDVRYLKGMNKIIEKICDLIAERGYTQQDFEEVAKLATNRVSKWRNKGEPTARQALRIARALGVTMEYLADDTQDEPVREFTEDEVYLIRTFRSLRLDVDAAVRRMAGLQTVVPRGRSAGDEEDAKIKKGRKTNGA